MKYLYKFFAYFALFCISIFAFHGDIPNISVGTATATSLHDSTFPIMYLQLNEFTVNTLHGYSSELDSANVRESITPLGTDKSFTVKISENESNIKRLDFELKDIANRKIITSNTLTAFSHVKKFKTAKIKLDASMDTSTEYGLKITLTTNYSKKIHFFTRVKYYDSDFFLKEKLDFINLFHQATFDHGKSLKLSDYLETDGKSDNTLANVTIRSSKKMVTWNKLKPKILTDCIPTIKELNIETAAVEESYYIEADTNSGTETYLVKEFYRVRYASGHIYLLYFQRTMEAMFNPDLTSLTQSEFKLGVTNMKSLNISSDEEHTKMAFVRNGSLWYYDLDKNKLNQVFSFEQNSEDYLRDFYDQHDIRILNIDSEGNIDFVVYGYMNCGDYEGRVGILLYNYTPDKNRINERVYIPLDTTYQRLKEDFGSFCYVNRKNIFYFSLYDTVYAYNITSRQYNILTKNASSDNFAMMEKAKCFVWSNATKKEAATSITILDLDSEKEITVSAKANQTIRVLGAIDSNIVYGFIRTSDIYNSTEGETISPVYKMVIADSQGQVLKKYQTKNIYITDTKVEDDIIRLKRVKKTGNRFRRISDDSIQHQKDTTAKSFDLTFRNTDKMLIEKYISLPAGFLMEKLPEIASTKYVMVTENTTLHFNNPEENAATKYYIYAYGAITGSTGNAGEAIQTADLQMGVVMDNRSHIVWERGGKFLSKSISNLDTVTTANGLSSIKACAQMLLRSAQITVDASQLKGYSAMDILKKHLDMPVNLSGCTVDEVLYFVSSDKPVIAMNDDQSAVLITAYDSNYITYYNPKTGTTAKMSILNAERHFKSAGYIFFSYV